MSGRGPAYSVEEMELLEKLARNTETSLEDRVMAFLGETGAERTESAVAQKLRKLQSDLTGATPKKRGPKPAKPAKASSARATPPAATPAARASATASKRVTNGDTFEGVKLTMGDVSISGPSLEEVLRAAKQLGAAAAA